MNRSHAFLVATLALFVASMAGHFALSESAGEWFKDTLENWQSEFLQVFWSDTGKAVLGALLGYQLGDNASKRASQRIERKLDELTRRIGRL